MGEKYWSSGLIQAGTEADPRIPDVQEVPPGPIPPAEQLAAQHQQPAEPEAAQGELELTHI